MNFISFCLFVFAGVTVSFIMLKEEKKEMFKVQLALDFVKYMSEQIKCFKLPLPDILDGYSKKDILEKEYANCSAVNLPLMIEELSSSGGKTLQLMETIMEGSYQQAVNGCAVLQNYLGDRLEYMKKDYESKKRMKTVFPVAIGILVGIFMI